MIFSAILPQCGLFLSVTTAKLQQSVQMISADVDEVMSGMIRDDNPKLGLLACPTWHKGQTLDAFWSILKMPEVALSAEHSSAQG